MQTPKMHISDPTNCAAVVADESEIYNRLLPLTGAIVVELGCGTAVHTRAIAEKSGVKHIHAFEVDVIQHERNLAAAWPSNVSLHAGGAEDIALADQAADIVMMFKSLHHVPIDLMDQALAEITRILRPGGFAYISEPVFAGDFNEVIRMFHDESAVRAAAFAAVTRAVTTGRFHLVSQTFFLSPMHFQDFAEFDARILNVTHTQHRLTSALRDAVKTQFETYMTSDGARFLVPIRVDLLRKPETDGHGSTSLRSS